MVSLTNKKQFERWKPHFWKQKSVWVCSFLRCALAACRSDISCICGDFWRHVPVYPQLLRARAKLNYFLRAPKQCLAIFAATFQWKDASMKAEWFLNCSLGAIAANALTSFESNFANNSACLPGCRKINDPIMRWVPLEAPCEANFWELLRAL